MWFSIFSLSLSLFAMGYSIYNIVRVNKEVERKREIYFKERTDIFNDFDRE